MAEGPKEHGHLGFLFPTPNELTEEQQRVLELIYKPFGASGRWPVFQFVDQQAANKLGLDLVEILGTLPSGLVHTDRSGAAAYQPQDRLWLTVDGIAYCVQEPQAWRDLNLFVTLLRWCAERYVAFSPASSERAEELTVTASEFASWLAALGPQWQASSVELTKLGTLLVNAALNVWSGASNPELPQWQFTLSREVRRYAGLKDQGDFAARRPQPSVGVPPGGAPAVTHASGAKPASPAYEDHSVRWRWAGGGVMTLMAGFLTADATIAFTNREPWWAWVLPGLGFVFGLYLVLAPGTRLWARWRP